MIAREVPAFAAEGAPPILKLCVLNQWGDSLLAGAGNGDA